MRARYKAFRKKLLSFTPFVRRSRHERALARIEKHLQFERKANETMGYLFFSPPTPAASARYSVRIPVKQTGTDELCLFVTHGATPHLKPHVVDHLEALLEEGIAVVLVVNTDLDEAAVRIPAELATRLQGCIIRQNIGYDFAAWAHAYALIDPAAVRERLFLINDSIVGPVDHEVYRSLLRRIRATHADFIGLTCNPDSHEHLQSFYLVFNGTLLHSPVFDNFMRHVVNMPTKQNVVDCYEIWLTPFLLRQGFSGVAMFPNIAIDPPPRRNDTLYQWRALLEAGFPFIKSQVLTESATSEAARALLPARYLRGAEDTDVGGSSQQ